MLLLEQVRESVEGADGLTDGCRQMQAPITHSLVTRSVLAHLFPSPNLNGGTTRETTLQQVQAIS